MVLRCAQPGRSLSPWTVVPLNVPNGGVRPFHLKSTCLRHLIVRPYFVQLCSRNTPESDPNETFVLHRVAGLRVIKKQRGVGRRKNSKFQGKGVLAASLKDDSKARLPIQVARYSPTTRGSMSPSSKVNLPHAVDSRALRDANEVTLPSKIGGKETFAPHRVVGVGTKRGDRGHSRGRRPDP